MIAYNLTIFYQINNQHSGQFSTETAILQVLSATFQNVDEGDFEVLALLYQSAACNTIYHNILLQRLQLSYGFNSLHFDGFHRTYLIEHKLYVDEPSSHPSQLYHMLLLKRSILLVLYTLDRFSAAH